MLAFNRRCSPGYLQCNPRIGAIWRQTHSSVHRQELSGHARACARAAIFSRSAKHGACISSGNASSLPSPIIPFRPLACARAADASSHVIHLGSFADGLPLAAAPMLGMPALPDHPHVCAARRCRHRQLARALVVDPAVLHGPQGGHRGRIPRRACHPRPCTHSACTHVYMSALVGASRATPPDGLSTTATSQPPLGRREHALATRVRRGLARLALGAIDAAVLARTLGAGAPRS